jgi:hypothetical protein
MADALARAEKGGSISQPLGLQTDPPGAETWAVEEGGWAHGASKECNQVTVLKMTGLSLCSFPPP